MTSILKTITLGLVFLCSASMAFAQTTYIKYTMSGDGEAATLMQGSAIEFYFNDKNVKMAMDMMGMIQMDMRMDVKKKEGIMLMDMMGQKQYKVMGEDDIEEGEGDVKMPEIKYLNKYETIAGYKCQKALVSAERVDEPIVVYLTDKMNMPEFMKDYMENMNMKGLKGFPLQYEVTDPEAGTIIVKAVEVTTKTYPKSIFSTKVPEGYTEMDEQSLKMMGGMMGG